MKTLIRNSTLAVLFGAVAPLSAQAAAIGIRGGNFDPLPSIYSTAVVELTVTDCAFLPTGFYCAGYDVPNDGEGPTVIDSIDFRMLKGDGSYFSVSEIGLFTVSGLSDLPNFGPSTLFPDGYTFTLYDPLLASLDCVIPGAVCRGDFFSDDPIVAAVQMFGVNGVGNAPVPEPASLVLVGGAALLFARRLRRSRR